MKTEAIKVLGKLHATPWERFVRLQRTVAQLAGRHGQPKGVYRFASHKECEEWTRRQTLISR